jgi:hypothetical protein
VKTEKRPASTRQAAPQTVVGVFSATMYADRVRLGERVTEWMRDGNVEVHAWDLVQSSDSEFHCVTFVLSGKSWDAPRHRVGVPFPFGCCNAVKVFSATKAHDRADLGDKIAQWMRELNLSPADVHMAVRQSSDADFHCLTIAVFYQGPTP